MNTPINKSIFNETGCIRKELLLKYRDKKLNGKEQHEIEEHLVDCLLCSEALEGLAGVSELSVLDSLDREIAGLTKPVSSFAIRPWLAAATLTGVIIFSCFTYYQFKNVQQKNIAAAELKVEDKSSIPHSANVASNSQDSNTIVFTAPEQHLQTLTEKKNNYDSENVGNDESEFSINEQVTETQVADPGKVLTGIEIPPAVASNIPPPSTIMMKEESNQNITYVDNIKIIDYTNYDASNVVQADVPRGTASRYQNKKNQAEVASVEKQSGDSIVRKKEYLELVADPVILFNKGRYESAIAGFDEMLMLNNKDENAIFYKGLSLFHLEKYSASLKQLIPISNDIESPFMEEAKIYAAEAYIGNKETSKAKIILEDIVKNNGFYAERAKVVLKNIK